MGEILHFMGMKKRDDTRFLGNDKCDNLNFPGYPRMWETTINPQEQGTSEQRSTGDIAAELLHNREQYIARRKQDFHT